MSKNPREPAEQELPDDYLVPYGFRAWAETTDPATAAWSVEVMRAEDLGRAVGALFGFCTTLIVGFFTFWAEGLWVVVYVGLAICALTMAAAFRWLGNRARFSLDRDAFVYQERTLLGRISHRWETPTITSFAIESDPTRWADGRWFLVAETSKGHERIVSFEGVNDRGKSAASMLADRLETARRGVS